MSEKNTEPEKTEEIEDSGDIDNQNGESCDSLEASVTQMQQMALEGFQAIQHHLSDIQQALLALEARMGDLAARVHGIEVDLSGPEGLLPAEKEAQEKLDFVGQELGKKIKEILAQRDTETLGI